MLVLLRSSRVPKVQTLIQRADSPELSDRSWQMYLNLGDAQNDQK